jgi:release factor glutamine methyltransferase
MSTVAVALAAARAKLPASEARLLLGHVLGQSAAWLVTHNGEALDEDALLGFASLVARRAGGEPVAYLVGHREFFGRRFAVSPAVLIPRPETELLVELALARVGADSTATILDLGTGSGCIAITLALERSAAWLTAVDASSAALQVAAANARGLGAKLRLLQGDWYTGVAGERFDLIVGNPPYVADGDSHLAQGDLRHEPRQALASGVDGLDALRAIVGGAVPHLLPGGSLLLEHGYDQAAAVRELMERAGFSDVRVYPDLAGVQRVTTGNLPRINGVPADRL